MRLVHEAAARVARVLVLVAAAVVAVAASAPVAEAGRLVSESLASPALGRGLSGIPCTGGLLHLSPPGPR